MTSALKQRLRSEGDGVMSRREKSQIADLIEQLEAERDELKAALENCRLLAARNRHEEWAQHILRFCLDAGVSATPIRDAAIAKGEKNA